MISKLKNLWFLIALLIFIPITLSSVNAADQTQQFNKIFMNPFYRASMTNGVNNTYNFTLNPPDGITSVSSAIISLQVYITPTVTFNIWVNNIACNTPSYTVSTTFSGSGQGVITFDCSNVINKSGFYNVIIRPSSANTGASTAWVDLTYTNNPGKKLDIFGTEYTVGDSGKVFIQLLENQITPINNATCYLTIWYPGGTKLYDKTTMTYLSTSNGIYYFDFTAPSTLGVYMTDVYCEYYTTSSSILGGPYAIATGWYVSGNTTSVTYIDNNYLTIVEKNNNAGIGTVGSVTQVLQGHLDEYSGTSTADDSASPDTGTHLNSPTIGIYGGVYTTAYVKYSGAGAQATNYPAASKLNLNASDSMLFCFNFNESTTNANGNRLIDTISGGDGFRFSFEAGNDIRFTSDRSGTTAQTVQSPSSYLDSQFHTVCGFSNFTTMILYIDGSIVDNQLRAQSGTMTQASGIYLASAPAGGTAANVALDEICYIKGSFAATGASSVSTLVANYTTYRQCGIPAYTLESNFTISSVTTLANYYQFNILSTYKWNEVEEVLNVYIYNYTGSKWYQLPNTLAQSLTDTTIGNILTGNGTFINQFLSTGASGGNMLIKINDSLPTGATGGRFDFNQLRVDQTAYVQIPATQVRGGGEVHVTNIPQATTTLVNAQTPAYVWNNPTRTLTAAIEANLTSVQYAAIAANVWNATDRNLTYYADVTNYTLIGNSVWTSSATISVGLLSQISNYIWLTATNRSLTFYPAQTDQTNYTQFGVIINSSINSLVAPNVWNYTIRNLTFYPAQVDLTDYAKIQTMVWNATDRNLTYYANQVDLTNYSMIQNVVWNATTRNLTFYPAQVDLTNYDKIQAMTWNATDRNLTFYPTQVDLTNYSQIENVVWNASVRTLTFFPTVNATLDPSAYTAIVQNVWNYTTRNLTFYPDVTDYTKIQSMTWNATDRNLTYYQNFGDQTDYNKIQAMVWNATIRTLTDFNFTVNATVELNTTAIANAVWASVNRSLTDYNQTNQSDLTDYNKIQAMVWNATIRTLTSFNFTVNATDNGVDISSAVWAYTNKTVQFANGSVDTVTDIQDMGHTYVGGTEYIDGDNGKITIRLVRGTGSLAEVELGAICTVSITYPNNSYYVFNATMSELGDGAYYYNFIVPSTLGIYPYFTNCMIEDRKYFSLDDFHIYADNYSSIAPSVWNYTTRNLTFYPDTNVTVNVTVTGNNLTAQDVWDNPTRDLTYYPTTNISLTNESIQALGEAVWQYNGTINPNILVQFASSVSCNIQNLLSDLNPKWGVHINSC